MANFSEHFKGVAERIDILSEIQEPLCPQNDILAKAENAETLEIEDAASLFALGNDPGRRAEIHAAAERVRARLAPQSVEFIIPAYLTSVCQNECLYCGYRQSNPLAERLRLSLTDFERELDLILSWGHRQIELVLSDDPEFGPEKLAAYVELTRRKLDAVGGGVVALCSPVYEEVDYARLAVAGLDWVAEWQETYHQPHFDRWHFPGSRKRQFEFRLDIWDRTVAAGLSKVGLGALLGLYKWRFDALAVIAHGNYLRRIYGVEPYTLGIPRLKPARGVLASQKPSRFTVSDDDYRLIISVYHLAFPRSRLFFSTRESYQLNLSSVAAGDLFTVDCDTLPGGYLRPCLPGQFSTHSYPPRREVVTAFQQRGLCCRYLAEEATPPAAVTAASETTHPDLTRWAQQHAEIRARLRDWESILTWLANHRGEETAGHRAGEAALRVILRYLRTSAMAHCREEERSFFQVLGREPTSIPQLQKFHSDHERLGVDLDKFERQLSSYVLSGDPSVLLTLGDRIIRELGEHLDAEDACLTKGFGSRQACAPDVSQGVAAEEGLIGEGHAGLRISPAHR